MPSYAESRIDAELTRAEKVVFGKITPELPRQQRLATLEKTVVGKSTDKNAAFDKRLLCINRALGFAGQTSKINPPAEKIPQLAPDRHLSAYAPLNQSAHPSLADSGWVEQQTVASIRRKEAAEGDRLKADLIFGTFLKLIQGMQMLSSILERVGTTARLSIGAGLLPRRANLRPDDTELQTAVASIQAQFARNKSNTNPLIVVPTITKPTTTRAHSSLQNNRSSPDNSQ